MPTFTVFKGSKSGAPKKSTTTKPDELTGDLVYVKVLASGLCGTDLHSRTRDDMVLGHEGVAVVEDVGPDVKALKKGDRVGWGYAHNSCGICKECLSGEDIYCPERELYSEANLDQGSFATHAVWHESFLHKIPENVSDADAAPLQCGGATVYTALMGLEQGATVGVMGVGGLGHLAIQFAAKMGCRVVVLSGSPDKRQQALELGAHEFLALKNGDKLSGNKMDRLLVTTASQPDWETILPMMASRSKIYPLTVSEGNLVVPYMPLLVNGIAIQGSVVATRAVQEKMLDFASLHNIKPIIETFPMTEEGISEAMEKLDQGKVRYRAVLLPQ